MCNDECLTSLIDILLHQSGHIMLTDFDLSKGSHPPGKPSIIKSTSPHTVSIWQSQ